MPQKNSVPNGNAVLLSALIITQKCFLVKSVCAIRQRSNCKQTDRNVIQILHRLQIHRQICHIRFSCRQGFCKCCRKQNCFLRHMQRNRKHKFTKKNEDFSTRKSPRFYIYFLFLYSKSLYVSFFLLQCRLPNTTTLYQLSSNIPVYSW